VQLTSAVKKAAEAGPPLPSVNDNQAADLVAQAAKTVQTWDLDGTAKLLDQAKKLNDKQPYLWSVYGYVAAMRGTNLEAATDYKKELALHPDEQRIYGLLAQAQLQTGARDDAKQTLKSGLSQGPNVQLAMFLASLLAQERAYAEEAAVLEPAAAKQPDNEQIQLMLGTAEMNSGKTDAGSKTLVALLGTAKSYGILNDASYALADKNMDLALDEASMLKALDQISQESSTLTLASNKTMTHAQAVSLDAAWDTMGWIYFREHKLDQAKEYLRAAWLNNPSETVGLHLGELQEAQGEPNAALATYDMARAAVGNVRYNGMKIQSVTIRVDGMPRSETPDGKELERRIDALRHKGAVDKSSGEAFTRLQNLRKLKIGSAEGRSGTADYKVLMASAKVEDVQGPDSNEVHNADEMVKRVVAEGWWPKDSTAKMVREGLLNCHSGVCEFVMLPLQ
jgi:tetratricopeptide (TPR) repeat protein